MSGSGISYLPFVQSPYLQQAQAAIESEADAEKECRARERMLKDAGWDDWNWSRYEELASEAEALGRRLEVARRGGEAYESPVNPIWMQERRVCLGGAMHKISGEIGGVDTTATIMPANWESTPEQLYDVDPRQLLCNLYAMIYRYGGDCAKGFFLAGLHGEWDQLREKLLLHLHCWLAGEFIDVLDDLRKSGKMQGPTRLVDGKPKKRRAIRIRREPLYDRPKPYTYVVQGFWPSRYFLNPDTGEAKRGPRRRIPQPVHTDVLLWLDRWKLDDLVIRMGLDSNRHGLKMTRGM